MRVLLINANQYQGILAAAPIGLSYVATAAAAASHEVRVLDLCFLRERKTRLETAIREFSPEVVGMSVRNIDNVNMLYPISFFHHAEETVQIVRGITEVPIVVGGAGSSLCPAEVLRDLNADFIVVSEGEQSFVKLLDYISEGRSPEDVAGVGFYRNGHFHLTPPNHVGFSSGNPQVGKWIDMKPYEQYGGGYTIQSKRGCPQSCIYCTYNQTLEGRALRLRDPKEVVDEIEEAVLRYRPHLCEFVDAVFNVPYEHCMEILEEILRRPWKIRLTAMGVTPRNLTEELLNIMWRAGFASFMISPDSASESMIRSYGKGFTRDDLVHAAEIIGRTRFSVFWYFLIGGPGETCETLQESLDFVRDYLVKKKAPPYNLAEFFLGVRLYPRTRLWSIALQEQYITPASNPLNQLWYVSEGLDLDRAIEQLSTMARQYKEISVGFDEKYLSLSPFVPVLAKVLPMPKPHWRQIWGFNRLLVKLKLRPLLQPKNVAREIRACLQRQGYRGPLLKSSG